MKFYDRIQKMATAGLLLAGLCASAEAASSAPNFIIMYIDDLGWADTSVPMMDSEPESKSDFYQTPHLETLAARGMRFSNAYAPAPTCTPSRKSIQFGKTPGRLGYTFVHDVLAHKRNLTWVDEVSMADVLKESGKGYVTAHFGKGMAARERMNEIGYDVTDEHDIGSNGNFHGEYVDIKSRTPLPADDPKRMRSLKKSSVEFVREHAGKSPFFMMVSHYAVHVPHAASSELIEKYRNSPRGKHLKDEDYLPEDQISDGMKSSHWRLQYAAMIDEIDQGLGALVAELKAAGELENTYIIYTSDNGGGMRPNGPLGWGKAQLYEGGLRIAMVVAGPGVKAGVQCDEPVVQWDFLPTIHDLAGSSQPLPENLDGGSLRSVFEQGNAGSVERPVEGMVFHYPCYFAPPLSVIRVGDYKYMKHLLTGEMQLFNLKNDYSEKQNLAKAMPEKAAELDKILADYLESIDAEDVQDVYQARLEELDHFEAQSREIFTRESARLDPVADAAKIAKMKKRLDDNLARFDKNREEVAVYRTSSHWAGGPPNK
jgi:arylsulfatase A